jgi:hypothetical protein
VTGAVGGLALTRLQPFFAGEQMQLATTTGLMAGAYALWVSAAAGLARLQQRQDPLLARADALLRALADPMRTKLAEALASWNEVRTSLEGSEAMTDATRDEAAQQADKLIEAVLETCHTWNQIEREVKQPRAQGIATRIAELQTRADTTNDPTTKGHLGRALSALHAQHGAVRGLEVAMERADAAVDAQVALLDRLRFAVAQHRVSDRERFHMELSAVSEEASRVSADLETLSTAMAEADRFSDQTALADFEASLRRSLGSTDVGVPVTEEMVARR